MGRRGRHYGKRREYGGGPVEVKILPDPDGDLYGSMGPEIKSKIDGHKPLVKVAVAHREPSAETLNFDYKRKIEL
jgi:hypothetical protein